MTCWTWLALAILVRDAIVDVIDDDADVRQSLAFLLSTVGLAVRVHDSATSFLASLSEVQDGCIVTDVRMPGMDGIELQRRLRADGIPIPVIVITGHGDIALAVDAMSKTAAAMAALFAPWISGSLVTTLFPVTSATPTRGAMSLPNGHYRTKHGSEMWISGEHSGIRAVEFDWFEEKNACPECVFSCYERDGDLVWHCDEHEGGRTKLYPVDNLEVQL